MLWADEYCEMNDVVLVGRSKAISGSSEHVPLEARDLLENTRYGISFPDPSGCQMRFKVAGVDLGGFYSYSAHGGVRQAVIAAVADNMVLREKHRRRAVDGKPSLRLKRRPGGSTGVRGVSGGVYYDGRRSTSFFRYQVSWRHNNRPKSKSFHLPLDASADQMLHTFRTAIQFRAEWELQLTEFEPAKYQFWRSQRLYEPGHPMLPQGFWGA